MRCTGTTATLPKLGTIRTHESTRKLARRLEAGTARILSATVSRTAQRWLVSFTVEVDRAIPHRHDRPGSAIGIDLGIKSLLTCIDDVGAVITLRAPSHCVPRYENSGARPVPTPGRNRGRQTGGGQRPGWPASTPGSRTSAPTDCTRQQACSPPDTRRSLPKI